MVNRFTIGALMKLAKSIGANPQKFMGTKTNISFLGKGPTKNPLFQRLVPGLDKQVNQFASSTNKGALIEATEDAMGFATAGKLNSIQTEILGKNMLSLDKLLNPTLATVTKFPKQGSGIMSAKKTSAPFMGFKPKVVPKKASLAPTQQSFLKQLDEKILQTEEGFLTQADLNTMSPEVLDNLRRSVDPIGMQRMFGEITKFASGGLADIMQTPRRGRVVHPGGYSGSKRQQFIDLYRSGKGTRQKYIDLSGHGFRKKSLAVPIDPFEELMIQEMLMSGALPSELKDGGLAKILEVNDKISSYDLM